MSKPKELLLDEAGATFYAPGDEDAFFWWLRNIPCVKTVRGQGRSLYVELGDDGMDEDRLRELLALTHRYQIDMCPLAQFETDANRSWFRNNEAYWYKKVFK